MAFELRAEDIAVLRYFVHAETCENIAYELNLSEPVIKDIIYNLFHYRFIKNIKGGMLFPKDKLREAHFIATAKGLETINTSLNPDVLRDIDFTRG